MNNYIWRLDLVSNNVISVHFVAGTSISSLQTW